MPNALTSQKRFHIGKSTALHDLRATRILKVDHAGEYGAIAIYRAQIAFGSLFGCAYVPLLTTFLEHERRHFSTFDRVLKTRGISPCRTIFLCAIGGYALGLATALLGRRSVMICTLAVETVVNRHLEEQLEYLRERDNALYDAVASIVDDERHHRDVANAQAGGPGFRATVVNWVTRASTETVIWLGMRL